MVGRSGYAAAGQGHPSGARLCHTMQEYFHDGGDIATDQTLDLKFNSATFKAVLTTDENTYVAANHPIFAYFAIPQNLIKSTVSAGYPQTLDANYPTTMANLVTSYGIHSMYQQVMPEWDNDPANNGWAHNRFSEAGVGGSRPDIPTGLTRQQAYDQWMHFYQTANHDGNTDHHQLGSLINPSYRTRGWKTKANSVNAGSCHYAYEMGIDLVTLQRTNDDISGLIGSIGFIRGAATQYGKPWGWDVSNSRTWWGTGVTEYNSGGTLVGGWTAGTYKRTYYLEYMSGPDLIIEEAANYTLNGTTNINGRLYTPFGVTWRDFCDFAMVRHPYRDRGTPHVPIAIMKDHISFFEPRYGQFNTGRGVWYQQMTANGGENMLHNLMNMLYPNYHLWGSSTTTAEPWGSARWGEQFDVITERITNGPLNNYKAVIVSMNTVMDATLQAKLDVFARSGGIVVINAKQLTGTGHQSLTGITLVGSTTGSGTITWEDDSTTTSEAGFTYSTITLGTATRIARLGASTPMVTKNVLGSGEVWVVTPDWMSITANTACLNLGAKIIDELLERSQVATVTGTNHSEFDFTVNKWAGPKALSTVVTVINTSSSTTLTGTISITEPTVTYTVREWIADVAASFGIASGKVEITVSVPANDVKVYAVSVT